MATLCRGSDLHHARADAKSFLDTPRRHHAHSFDLISPLTRFTITFVSFRFLPIGSSNNVDAS